LLAFVPHVTHAQVPTGTPPFGSFGGGPDIINLANLNAHLDVPIINKPGRGGFNFTYDMSYDSSVWYPVGASGSQSWQFVPNWGWRGITEVATGYLSYSYTSVVCHYTNLNGDLYPDGWKTTYSNEVYHDYLGVPHPFPGSYWTLYSTCGSPASGGLIGPNSVDGAYTLSGSGLGSGVINKYGKFFAAPFNATNGVATATDRNGNQISVNSSGVFTDTLGTTALTVAGTAPSNTTFTYNTPTGGPTPKTMSYKAYTVKTNFGCSGIAEYGPTSNSLVDRITLPDGSYYQFNYEPTPGFSGDVTGRLASVTFPTGSTIFYTYTGSNNGIVCSDGSAPGLTRATPYGTWTYTRSIGSGAASTTTITAPGLIYDPAANQTKIQFQGIYETQRQVYQGSTSGTLLETLNTCYNGAAPPCTATAITLPITSRTVLDQIGASGPTCKHVSDYSTFGVLTEQDDYDYGASGPGGLLRKVIINVASLANNINGFQQLVTVCNATGSSTGCNGTGTVVAQTTYNYDESTPTATSGTPQHIAVSGSRGNLTSFSQLVAASTLTSHSTYYDTGAIKTSTDVNGAVTTLNYGSASCGNSLPTSVSEPLSMSRSTVWDCPSGLPTSATDENNQTTSFTYDGLLRSTQQNFPDGGQTQIAFNTITNITTKIKMTASQTILLNTELDGLGALKQTQLQSDPQGTDYTDTTLDAVGRVSTVSNPYRSTSDPTYGLTTYRYDALGRTTSVILQDGSASTVSYSGNTVTATDPAGKKRQSTYDSLGRLTQVVEDPGGLGYISTYSYDAVGNLLSVVQNSSRQRTFAYDGLSRLTSETNPESGTTTYAYDSDAACPTPNSFAADLVKRVDARLVRTCYQYDALHRLTQKNYSDGTTPTAHFLYDSPVTWGNPTVTTANDVGRLSEAWVDNCPSAGGAEIFSYDSVGRVILNNQSTPANCGTGNFQISYTYDLSGNMTSYTNGGSLTFSQAFDSAGRATVLTQNLVDANHPATLATVDSSIGFYPIGAIRKMTLGNGLLATGAFNKSLQPCRYNTNSSGIALGACTDAIPSGSVQDFNLGFNAGSADNGNVASMTATGTQNFSRSYSFDSLNRLSQLQETSGNAEGCKPSSSSSNPYSISWTYDAWGNRTNQSPSSGTCSFSQTVNTQNHLSGSTFQYDAAGNLIADGSHTYTYDAENRLTKVDGGNTASYLYDATGRRSRKTVGSAWTDFIYDLSGNVLTEFNSVCAPICVARDYFSLGGQRVGQFFAGLTYFVHTDHLGSTRLVTSLQQSQIPNGGFEQGMTNWLPDTGPSIVTDATRAHSGNNYLQISTSTGAEATNSQFVAVVPGQVITFGGWAYRESGTTGLARWKLITYDANQNPITFPSPSPSDVSTAAWTFQQGTYVIPTGTAFVRLYCEVYQPTAATVARFDDGFLDSTGAPTIVENLDYLPFGEILSTDSGISTHKFTGDERDAETSLDHTWFRQYSSQFGRWTSPDPAGLAAVDPGNPQSWNRYVYALNNSMNMVDPSGLYQCPTAPLYDGSCLIFGGGGLGPGGMTCMVDGVTTDCGQVFHQFFHDDKFAVLKAALTPTSGGEMVPNPNCPPGGDCAPFVQSPYVYGNFGALGLLGIGLGGNPGGNSSWAWTFTKTFVSNFQLLPSSLRLPGESFAACVDRTQKALLGGTGASILNNVTGVSTVASIFTQPIGTTTVFAPAGKSVMGNLVQVGLDSGATDVSTAYQMGRGAGVVGKVAGVVTAIGLGIEGGFAISCR
jgi:RHS repeat-associated protein